MNLSKAILLVNKNIRLIEAIYEIDPEPGTSKPPAKRYRFKTLDRTIIVGDLILVPTDTRYKASVNKVTAIDVELDDYDSDGEIRWMIGRVDKTAYDASVKMEAEATVMIRDAEKRSKQEELRKKLLEANPDLRSLDIARATSAVIEHIPPAPPPYRGRSFDDERST